MYTHTHCVMLTVLQCERRVIFFWAFATFFPGIRNLFSGHTQPFFRAFASVFSGHSQPFFQAFAPFFPGICNIFSGHSQPFSHHCAIGAWPKKRRWARWREFKNTGSVVSGTVKIPFTPLLKQIFVHFAQTPWRNFFWGGNGTR